ncbi:TraR/DksA family transcriptional regulator [Shimia isoporae]|uniref:TraR/DksA family transcriptional regulator n=1 Tax=Shimia isoporae TaxID=647720 RepID=A0A4V2Q3Y9_9RHOB|nr:TraR/DksA family transcriptional regulator [Shimia isoporae]TCL09040.1 TraR/DksA family transcriptional regulator [Shimia isoporae]
MTDVVARKGALMARLAELDERIHNIEAELDVPHTKDIEDQAQEVEGEEVLEVLEQQSLSEVVKIQAALKRLRDGEYGDCLSCGEEIAEARLDLVPEATMCVTCAARHAG